MSQITNTYSVMNSNSDCQNPPYTSFNLLHASAEVRASAQLDKILRNPKPRNKISKLTLKNPTFKLSVPEKVRTNFPIKIKSYRRKVKPRYYTFYPFAMKFLQHQLNRNDANQNEDWHATEISTKTLNISIEEKIKQDKDQ